MPRRDAANPMLPALRPLARNGDWLSLQLAARAALA
jgi:hypothetical protein